MAANNFSELLLQRGKLDRKPVQRLGHVAQCLHPK